MRAKSDAKLNQRLPGRKTTPPPGGKVLQRLFNYLAKRDPALNDDVVASVPIPKSARQKFTLTDKARRANAPTADSVARARSDSPKAKGFAAELIKAAAKTSGAKKAKSNAKIAKVGASPSAVSSTIWQSIGPTTIPNGQTYGTNKIAVAGRMAAVAVDPGNPKHLLAGAAGGGIWESIDDGATWNPRTDRMPSLAIGAIAFDPSNPKRVYAGSGEGNFYANLGAGVYVSANGGTTWTVLAQAPFVGVGFFGLLIDPADVKALYAATTNGFYRSTNSGKTWTRTRANRCWAVSVHPAGGKTELLATFDDGLFVSTDAGASFTAVTLPSFPAGPLARLAVDRVRSSPDVAYVFGATQSAGFLWRRQAATWTAIPLTTLKSFNVTQAWYDWYVVANPTSPSQVYLGAIDAYRGDLTGTTWKWTNISTQGSNSIHPDQHCLAIAPSNPKIVYAGSDGGLFRSDDSGAHWKSLNNGLVITELEYIAGDPGTWQWLMAGTQDNGTLSFTGQAPWLQIAMGDGGDCGVNQLQPKTIYHSYYDVSLERSDDKGKTWSTLNPPPTPSLFYPPVEVFGSTVAIGATSLLVTRSGKDPWTTVKLGLSPNEVSSSMRDVDANTIIVGTNGGRLLKLAWSGSTWKKTQLTSPAARYISCIAVDPSNPQRIWVTFSQVSGGSVFRSDDGGVKWTDCTANLPHIPMNALVVDPANFKRVWVAADLGVYQSLDLGATWAPFATGLPNAMAADLLIHKQDRILVCATRSRGAWVIAVP